jgi:DNA polymerase-3 subunit delta'
LTSLPSLDPRTALALADEMAGRGNEEKFRLFGDILGGLLGRAACVAGGGMPGLSIPGEEETLRRLANVADFPTWSELWERSASLIAKAEGLTLDRKQVTLTLLSDLERATRP